MVTDPSAERIDKYIGDEPPDDSQAICGLCGERREEHVKDMGKWGARISSRTGICPEEAQAILDHLRENEFEELTDDDIASMKADEEYSRRKDEGLL